MTVIGARLAHGRRKSVWQAACRSDGLKNLNVYSLLGLGTLKNVKGHPTMTKLLQIRLN